MGIMRTLSISRRVAPRAGPAWPPCAGAAAIRWSWRRPRAPGRSESTQPMTSAMAGPPGRLRQDCEKQDWACQGEPRDQSGILPADQSEERQAAEGREAWRQDQEPSEGREELSRLGRQRVDLRAACIDGGQPMERVPGDEPGVALAQLSTTSASGNARISPSHSAVSIRSEPRLRVKTEAGHEQKRSDAGTKGGSRHKVGLGEARRRPRSAGAAPGSRPASHPAPDRMQRKKRKMGCGRPVAPR